MTQQATWPVLFVVSSSVGRSLFQAKLPRGMEVSAGLPLGVTWPCDGCKQASVRKWSFVSPENLKTNVQLHKTGTPWRPGLYLWGCFPPPVALRSSWQLMASWAFIAAQSELKAAGDDPLLLLLVPDGQVLQPVNIKCCVFENSARKAFAFYC